MKKLLALVGAVGLVATSSATVIACNDVASLAGYADSIENNLKTESFTIAEEGAATGDVKQWDMGNYFSLTGELQTKGNADAPDDVPTLTEKIFETAIEKAVDAVVSGSAKATDYTFTVEGFGTTGKDSVKVKIQSNSDSSLWRGDTTIIFTGSEVTE